MYNTNINKGMNMATIGELIYQMECSDQGLAELSVSDALKLSRYLINNLNEHHSIPGKIYNQFIGILFWYNENNFITEKQHYWLLDNCQQYIDQRQYCDLELF
jgi:hypothetical protein